MLMLTHIDILFVYGTCQFTFEAKRIDDAIFKVI